MLKAFNDLSDIPRADASIPLGYHDEHAGGLRDAGPLNQ
jgi:hypothetical protein